MWIRWALAIAAAALASNSPALAQIIPDGQCAVIIASRPSLPEARQWISDNPSYPATAIIKFRNGQYGVTIGLIDKSNWRDRVAAIAGAGQATPDVFCSSRGAEAVAWSGEPPPQAPAAPQQPSPELQSSEVALLLFDGETGAEFAGCLNCNKYDGVSVCNKYGEYGSKYSQTSIWNPYGDFGSRYRENSPWNKYGEGLRIVDADGAYYGKFSASPYGQSRLEIVKELLSAFEAMDDLEALRNLMCER